MEEQTGWTFSSTHPPIDWNIDSSPSDAVGKPFYSSPNSLNYNNGGNYQTGIDANSGTALSPVINIANLKHPYLTFWCNFSTDDPNGDTDLRIVRIKTENNATTLKELKMTPSTQCVCSSFWHPHSIPLESSWGNIRIEFSFNTVTGLKNDFAGWFIDNLSVDSTLISQRVFHVEYFDSTISWKFTSSDLNVKFNIGNSSGKFKPISAPFCLKYNNGTDYNSGNRNYGTASSQPIKLTESISPFLVFYCNYSTDTTNHISDQRFISILDAKTGAVLVKHQLTATEVSDPVIQCNDTKSWHGHALELNPRWDEITIEFSFDTITDQDNDREGWFIDNVLIVENAVNSIVSFSSNNRDSLCMSQILPNTLNYYYVFFTICIICLYFLRLKNKMASERGVIGVIVVFFMLIAAGIWITVIIMHSQQLDAENEKLEKLEVEKQEIEKGSNLEKLLDPLIEPIGFEREAERLPVQKVLDHLKQNKEGLLKLLLEDPELFKSDRPDERSRIALAETKEFKTIETLLIPYISVASYQMSRSEEWRFRRDIEKARLNELEKVDPDKFKITSGSKKDYFTTLQQRVDRLNADKQAAESDFTAQKEKLNNQIQKIDQDIQKENDEFKNTEIEIAIKISKIIAQIDAIKLKIETRHFSVTRYVATISNPDLINNICYVNIGSRNRIKQGMRFLIANYSDNGRFDYKAEIEIQKMDESSSQAKIIKINKKDNPPITGDFVVNPFFNPNRPLKVAFVGRKDPKIKIGLDEAKKRVKQLGNEVLEEITSDLDFIIVTEPEENTQIEQNEQFRKAVEFGIPIGQASDLLEFLLYR